jgi:hypothetical protein
MQVGATNRMKSFFVMLTFMAAPGFWVAWPAADTSLRILQMFF